MDTGRRRMRRGHYRKACTQRKVCTRQWEAMDFNIRSTLTTSGSSNHCQSRCASHRRLSGPGEMRPLKDISTAKRSHGTSSALRVLGARPLRKAPRGSCHREERRQPLSPGRSRSLRDDDTAAHFPPCSEKVKGRRGETPPLKMPPSRLRGQDPQRTPLLPGRRGEKRRRVRKTLWRLQKPPKNQEGGQGAEGSNQGEERAQGGRGGHPQGGEEP